MLTTADGCSVWLIVAAGAETWIGGGDGAGWKGRCGPNAMAASPSYVSAIGVYAGGASSVMTSIMSLELEDCAGAVS